VSLATRLARADVKAAEKKLKLHQSHCSGCLGFDPCQHGQQLGVLLIELRAIVRREAELDRQPDPNQAILFDLKGIADE
jgi:hypothetical protein